MLEMLDDTETLLQRFRDWLTQTDEELRTLPADLDEPNAAGSTSPPIGLLQVVESFTALRQELKLQTKGARGLEEAVQNSLQGLETAIRQFQTVEARENQAADRAVKPLIEALIGMDEALERGAKAVDAAERQPTGGDSLLARLDAQFQKLPAWRRWWSRRWHEEACRICDDVTGPSKAWQSLREGYQLIRARLRRSLAEQQIARIETVGRRADPALMTVVELVDEPAAAPETVVSELRPGYTWRDRVVRFAEVRVARPGNP